LRSRRSSCWRSLRGEGRCGGEARLRPHVSNGCAVDRDLPLSAASSNARDRVQRIRALLAPSSRALHGQVRAVRIRMDTAAFTSLDISTDGDVLHVVIDNPGSDLNVVDETLHHDLTRRSASSSRRVGACSSAVRPRKGLLRRWRLVHPSPHTRTDLRAAPRRQADDLGTCSTSNSRSSPPCTATPWAWRRASRSATPTRYLWNWTLHPTVADVSCCEAGAGRTRRPARTGTPSVTPPRSRP
jgi:hypothetical protein